MPQKPPNNHQTTTNKTRFLQLSHEEGVFFWHRTCVIINRMNILKKNGRESEALWIISMRLFN